MRITRLGAVVLAVGLSACSSSGSHPASSPSWRTTFQSQADRICTTAQQQVSAAQHSARIPVYPPSFPAPAFASYLRRTHGIGAHALGQVKGITIPADGVAERDAGLKPLEQQVQFAAAAASAAQKPDGAAYARLAGGTVDEAPATLMPRSCLGLSLGPSAH